jgi:hypothetical protein
MKKYATLHKQVDPTLWHFVLRHEGSSWGTNAWLKKSGNNWELSDFDDQTLARLVTANDCPYVVLRAMGYDGREDNHFRDTTAYHKMLRDFMDPTKPITQVKRFWLVWNPATGGCHKRHPTQAEARTEAERLATKNPGQTFIVMQSNCEVATTAPRVMTVFHG